MNKLNISYLSSIADKTVDVRGLRCPETITMIRKIMNNIDNGKKLFIISDDPAIIYDIPIFCCFMKYSILEKNIDIPYFYLLKK